MNASLMEAPVEIGIILYHIGILHNLYIYIYIYMIIYIYVCVCVCAPAIAFALCLLVVSGAGAGTQRAAPPNSHQVTSHGNQAAR